MAEKKLLPAVLKPLAEMNDAEKLAHATGLALDEIIYALNLPREPEALKAMGLDPQKTQRMKMETAQSVIATRAKVDDSQLRHVEHTDKIDILMQKLRAVKMPTR
jgi:hypothetical protein